MRREWLVIESSRKFAVFSADEDRTTPKGYIPRDVAEALLGRSISDGAEWFDARTCAAMRAHPEWRATLADIDAESLVAEGRERAAMWGME